MNILFSDFDDTLAPELLFDVLFIFDFSKSNSIDSFDKAIYDFIQIKKKSRKNVFDEFIKKGNFKGFNVKEIVKHYQTYNFNNFDPLRIEILKKFSFFQCISDRSIDFDEFWIITDGNYGRQKNKIAAFNYFYRNSGNIILDPNIAPNIIKKNFFLSEHKYFKNKKISGLMIGNSIDADKKFADNNNLDFQLVHNNDVDIEELLVAIKNIT